MVSFGKRLFSSSLSRNTFLEIAKCFCNEDHKYDDHDDDDDDDGDT